MCASPVIQKLETTDGAIDEVEWETRVDLAACYRLIEHYDMDDLFATHISVRAPGADDHFLLNPYGVHFSEITASSLVKVDLDGNIVQKTDHVINPAGFVIHSAVHAARHDAKCVLHTHTVAGMAAAALKDPIKNIDFSGMMFTDRVAFHDFEGVTIRKEECQRLTKSLNDKDIMILRNHGLLTVGSTIAHAFIRMHNLERACEVQLKSRSVSSSLVEVSDNIAKAHADEIENSDNGDLAFKALMRLMDKIDPSYRN